jgi:hypothetical protein
LYCPSPASAGGGPKRGGAPMTELSRRTLLALAGGAIAAAMLPGGPARALTAPAPDAPADPEGPTQADGDRLGRGLIVRRPAVRSHGRPRGGPVFRPRGFRRRGFRPRGFRRRGFRPRGFRPRGFRPRGFGPRRFRPRRPFGLGRPRPDFRPFPRPPRPGFGGFGRPRRPVFRRRH